MMNARNVGPAASAENGIPQLAFWLVAVLLVTEYPRPDLLAQLKVQLVSMLLLGAMVFTNRSARIRSRTLIAGALLCVITAKSLLYCINDYSAYTATLGMLGYLVIASGLAWVCSDDKLRQRVIDLWVLILAYCSAYALFHGGRGPGGFMGDENDLAVASSIGLSFALFGAAGLTGRKRALYGLFVPLFIAAVVMSVSRGGFLATGAVIAYFLWRQPGFGQKVLFIAAAVGMFFILAPDEYKQEIFSLGDAVQEVDVADSTTAKRYYLWTAGVNMFLSNPVLGVGADNFIWNVGAYQPRGGGWPEAFSDTNMTLQAAHSMYVQMVAELALPGVILWLYIVASVFVPLHLLSRGTGKTDGDERQRLTTFQARALSGAIVAYMAGGVSLSLMYYPYLWYVAGISLGLMAASRRVVDEQASSRAAQAASAPVVPRRGRISVPDRRGQRPADRFRE